MGYVLSPALSTTGVGRARTNAIGWASAVVSDPIARAGVVWQYASWFDRSPELSRLKTAGRSRPEGDPNGWSAWTVWDGTTGLNGNVAGDPHLAVTLGVSKSGKLHIWWHAHGNEFPQLHWAGSGPGDFEVDFAEEDYPAGVVTAGPAPPSYPQAFNLPDGTLCYSSRLGTAGNNAQQCLYEQSADETSWHLVSATLNDWPAGGDEESPYMQRILCHLNGVVHVSWCWAKQNVTDQYHDVMYMRGLRVSEGVWVWQDIEGDPVTLPANNDARFLAASVPVNSGLNVHSGMACTGSGVPLIPYFKADGAGTRLWLATRENGEWVQRDVGLASATWNLIDSPPNSEYAVVRTADIVCDGSATHYIYSSNEELGASGKPVVMVRSSFDPRRVVWLEPEILIDEPIGDACPRIDRNGWDRFGALSLYVQLLDEDANFGNAAATSVYVADFDLPENPNMGTLSSYARTALINHVRNKAAYTPAATHYCAAFVAGVEVTGNSYARVGLTNNKTTWGDAGSRAITNDVAFTFDDATGSWGTIDEIRIYDASSGGNELARHTLSSSVAISDSTGPLTVPIGDIDITFAAG